MLLRQVIGNVFRRLRRERGITLRELAELAQVSVPYLSEIERGRKEPSSEILAAICRALDLELTDLLAEVQFDLATAVRSTLPVRLQTAAIRVQQAPQRDHIVPARVLRLRPGVRPGRLVGALVQQPVREVLAYDARTGRGTGVPPEPLRLSPDSADPCPVAGGRAGCRPRSW